MPINPISLSLRSKKLGVLIQDARLANQKSVTECAESIGVSESRFEAFELGEDTPSLPELEILAYYLQVPFDHFWGQNSLSESGTTGKRLEAGRLVEVRQRMIGVLLQQARQKASLSLEQAAEKSGFPVSELEAYEFGDQPVRLPVLEVLAELYKCSVRDFQDQKGPVGVWTSHQRALQDFKELPPELQAFVCKPVNRPYLELAQRLSEMSVDKLRSVAEGLLEITL
jgi:transcriptional regulator with XRE-family HTH domain